MEEVEGVGRWIRWWQEEEEEVVAGGGVDLLRGQSELRSDTEEQLEVLPQLCRHLGWRMEERFR